MSLINHSPVTFNTFFALGEELFVFAVMKMLTGR